MALVRFKPPEGSRYFGLLATLLMIIIGYPYLRSFDASGLILTLLAGVIPVMSILALTDTRRELYVGIGLAIPAIAALLQEGLGVGLVSNLVAQTFPLLLYLYATTMIVRRVVSDTHVGLDTMLGAITGYLMLGYTWSIGYMMIEMTDPGSFKLNVNVVASDVEPQLNSLYFSFVTLTTVGYGDIVPISEKARSLAMLESMAGVLYLAVLVSRLIALYRGREDHSDVGPE